MKSTGIGNRIKALRKSIGDKRGWPMTQLELGKKAGIAAAQIAHYEGGSREPTLGNFARLCRAFEVSADELLGLAAHCGMEGDGR